MRLLLIPIMLLACTNVTTKNTSIVKYPVEEFTIKQDTINYSLK